MRANEQLAELVRTAGALMAQRGDQPLPPPPFAIEYRVGGCRYRLRFASTPEAAELRAKRLLRAVREGTNNHPLPGKPQQSRRPFSLATYQQFIDDGELGNAEAYRGLYVTD